MLFIIELLLGFSIGLSLGLLGGGGSILTVPALVYIVGQSAHAAVTTSLAIVGANSLVGASFHRAQGTLRWNVALIFGGTGMLVAYFAAGISKQFSPPALLVAFAVLMLVVGGLMFQQRGKTTTKDGHAAWWVIALGGAGVGLITGVLGVGGGFLIVPALVMLVGLPMPEAVGTSLLVIAMNSASGLLGHLGEGTFDWGLTLTFVAAGLAGSFIGAKLTGKLPADKLRQLFGLFVIALALFLLYDNIPKVL